MLKFRDNFHNLIHTNFDVFVRIEHERISVSEFLEESPAAFRYVTLPLWSAIFLRGAVEFRRVALLNLVAIFGDYYSYHVEGDVVPENTTAMELIVATPEQSFDIGRDDQLALALSSDSIPRFARLRYSRPRSQSVLGYAHSAEEMRFQRIV